jgi:voltage-gated potassium channel
VADPNMSIRARLQSLYFGETEQARRFRYGVILFDITTLATFIITAAVPGQWWIIPLDLLLALALSLGSAARLYAEPDRRAHLLSFATLTDLVVILSLLLAAFIDNYAFLRVIRSLRIPPLLPRPARPQIHLNVVPNL